MNPKSLTLAFCLLLAALAPKAALGQTGEKLRPAAPKFLHYPIHDGFIEANGVLIYYTTLGRGEPLLIVHAVEGMQPGRYARDLTLIEAGDFRRGAADLALGQPIAAQAAVNVYFMADLDAVFDRLGERGYRVAQMAGAIAGGRLELAATAAGLGATGLTFFDDEVTEFFEPAARGRQVMYLAAAGPAG